MLVTFDGSHLIIKVLETEHIFTTVHVFVDCRMRAYHVVERISFFYLKMQYSIHYMKGHCSICDVHGFLLQQFIQ